MMNKKKRGQISTEYLIVVGFIVFLVIGILSLAFFYATSADDVIRINQINNFANKILSNAESVFFAGEPSRVSITAYLPKGVNSVSIIDDNLYFNVSTSSGISLIAFQSDVPISGSLRNGEGVKAIKIVASQDAVSISDN